ncbi:MAG: glycosyltransferase family 2 protein [Solirubrobacteraceae bacterium]|nr:glycosyltransferase family 2 protein [Solirubrobacteraceae bacterium]
MALRPDIGGRANRLSGEIDALRAELAETRDQLSRRQEEHIAEMQHLHNVRTVQLEALKAGQARLLEAVRAATDDDAGSRARLAALRASPAYEAAFTVPEPLVSIVMPTYDEIAGLTERSVPSALAQTYPNVEVIVVGDHAAPETGAALAEIDDPRLHYENLAVRGPYSEEPKTFWYTAGTYALNRAMALARGQWIAVLNDDDAHHPEFVERLLAHARAEHAEVAYGKLLHREPEKDDWELGSFPPTNHAFGWQMAIQHAGLRMFEYELHAPVYDEPGDWHRAFRMLRAGVRFSMLDAVVGDYYPSTLWKGRRT